MIYFNRAGPEMAYFIVGLACNFLKCIAEPLTPNAQLCLFESTRLPDIRDSLHEQRMVKHVIFVVQFFLSANMN